MIRGGMLMLVDDCRWRCWVSLACGAAIGSVLTNLAWVWSL